MIENCNSWVLETLAALQSRVGDRLLYLGLQGSYRRGEAGDNSDIDLVVIFDEMDQSILEDYRAVIKSRPHQEKACGFVCGRAELAAWPRHELFQFKMDTADFLGRLDDYLPPISRADIEAGVTVGASGLYHALAHTFIFAPEEQRAEVLRAVLKGAFFVMLSGHYLATGHYCQSKKELYQRLTGQDKNLAAGFMDFDSWLKGRSLTTAYDEAITWCRQILKAFQRA